MFKNQINLIFFFQAEEAFEFLQVCCGKKKIYRSSVFKQVCKVVKW